MVALEGLPYPVSIASGGLSQIGAIAQSVTPGNRLVILTDTSLQRVHDARLAQALRGTSAEIVSAAMDERRKTRETWADLTDKLLEKRYGRDTTIIAYGGGVVGDVAGFVAATYMRGVPFIQVPTTLLAMVDASVGGKTGVDTPAGKNLVGAFHQPAAVIIDPELLDTLPVPQMRAGFAEIIKHGVIADAAYFETVRKFVAGGGLSRSSAGADGVAELTRIIRRSVEIKASIVARDERESGLRKVLNFGHTLGHAIEAAADYSMLHGEAVAIGLVYEARIAERVAVAASGTAQPIEQLCRDAGLPTRLEPLSHQAVLEFTRADKKARNGKAEYALPARIGEMASRDGRWSVAVEDGVVREVLQS